jgi:1,4-dihydroxy-2-naphthoyl-CoA hydrolase
MAEASPDDFFQRFNDNPFHQYMGLTIAEVSPDLARLRLSITPTTPTGIGGSVNGGVLASMVDMAAVAAVFSQSMPGSSPAGTADLSITYLRQAHGQYLDAIATVVKRGRQLCTVSVDIVNEQGRLCCRGQVLYAMRTDGPQN